MIFLVYDKTNCTFPLQMCVTPCKTHHQNKWNLVWWCNVGGQFPVVVGCTLLNNILDVPMKRLSFSLLTEMCVCKRPVPPLLPYHESYPHSIIILISALFLSLPGRLWWPGRDNSLCRNASNKTISVWSKREDREHSAVGEKSWRYLSTEKSNKHVLTIVLRLKCWLCDNCGLYSINPIWALLPRY